MTYREEYQKWMDSGVLKESEREELRRLAHDEKELESRFYGPLEFGTAGLRGVMGTGLNRMNPYVVRHVTQAFAQVILTEKGEAAKRFVAICFDCRNNSIEFAREAACVMAGNGIPVLLFRNLRPTPELSFAVREYDCIAGINITASHNPKEYNGYKVYWSDGAQLPPQHAAAIARRMKEIDLFGGIRRMEYGAAIEKGMISLLGAETDAAFLKNVMEQAINRDAVAQAAKRFTVVYTPFHGTGYQLIPEALSRLGIRNLLCVKQQMVIDGNFPTVNSPNPEEPKSFAMSVRLAEQHHADLIIGSDPDADRVGIMARNAQGEYESFSGNQTGVLLLNYFIGARKKAGTLPQNAAVLKSVVTTKMARAVSESYGVPCIDTFTGFKFMAEKKGQLEEDGAKKVIFSYEESYGYMVGDYVRDKDAVTASMLLAEMAAWYDTQNKTLFDALEELYERLGYYGERTMNLLMPGLDGICKMKSLMRELRKNPLSHIEGVPVLSVNDYESGLSVNLRTGKEQKLELCGGNLLSFELEDGTSFMVRPSGTEPKIKVYILAKETSRQAIGEKVARYAAFAKTLPECAR